MTHHDQICADTLSSPTTSDKNPFVFCCSPYKNGCTSWCTCCQHAIQTPFPKIQKLSRGKIMHAAMKPNIHTYLSAHPVIFFSHPLTLHRRCAIILSGKCHVFGGSAFSVRRIVGWDCSKVGACAKIGNPYVMFAAWVAIPPIHRALLFSFYLFSSIILMLTC